MTLYRLSGVTKVYDQRTVLDIAEMNFEAGRRYALLGPNGAGKTTLLNILAFLDRPDTGTIEFNSAKVNFSRKHLRALRRKVVLVDQHPILFTRTVAQNIAYGLKLRKIPARERNIRVAESLEHVGMTAFSGALAHRLSGGETQRVALARALVLDPWVLLCDEPTAGVDAEHQAAILKILKEINQVRGVSLIFTSHDPGQAAILANETIYLNNGRQASAGHENTFSADLTSRWSGRAVCRIQNGPQILLTDEGGSAVPRKVRIEINPGLLILDDETKAGASENRFAGRMIQAIEEKSQIRCVVDIGVRINITLSKSAYRKSRPLIGDTVAIQIPAEAVRLI